MAVKSSKIESSKFKHDIAGILLLALALFILVSNLSSATGLVGFYLVKTFLRGGVGLGIYFLPFFVALYGAILLLRQEIKELATRFTGLLILFLVLITWFQLYEEAGGMLGFGLKYVLLRTVGMAGSYILTAALFFISMLLIFNVTFLGVFSFLAGLLTVKREAKKEGKKEKTTVAVQFPLIKELPTEKVEIPSPPEPEPRPVIEFPVPKAETIATTEGRRKTYSKYKLPPLDLLDDPTIQEKQRSEKLWETTELRKKLLEEALMSFGVGARVVSVHQGPAVTRFELQPDSGVKVSKINSLADDIALNLASQGVRIEAPVPGKSVVGIEVPNAAVTPVRLKEIAKTTEFQKHSSPMLIGLGKDLSGTPIYGDLVTMPHLLIAGTTGSGKSVCINSLITSILLRARPDEVKFIMIDPKMVELSIYDGIAHLLAPVVTDPRKAARTLKEWVVREMERRYKLFHETGTRNIQAYNKKSGDEDRLPYIVVIVDELADLMMVAAADVETTICRIAQMARATGIHMVIATQRPSVDILTGLIKANIPSRIAFAVATQVDSRVILDMSGAEKLLGRGDMLYSPVGAMKPLRLQGSYVSDKETEKIIVFIKEQAEPEYIEEITSLKPKDEKGAEGGGGERDSLFAEVANLIVESGQASTSYIQRKLRIGYNRAARLMDEMEIAGVVSKAEGELKIRRVLATRESLKSLGVG